MSANREKTLEEATSFILFGAAAVGISYFFPYLYFYQLLAATPDPLYFPAAGAVLPIGAGVLGLMSRGCLSGPKETRWPGVAAVTGIISGLIALLMTAVGGFAFYKFANRKAIFAQDGWLGWWLSDMNAANTRLGFAPFLYLGGSIAILIGLVSLMAAEED